MNVDQAIDLGREAITMTLVVGSPIMIVAVAVGLVVSILQAVTQLQDQTLSFVPKIIAMFLALIYVLPWLMMRMVDYTSDLLTNVPGTL